MLERATRLVATFLVLAGCAGAGVSGVPEPRPEDVAADRWIEETLARLTLRQKIGQLIVPWIGGEYLAVDSDAHDRLREWVQEYGVGGFVVSIGPPLEIAAKLNVLQRLADVPLLIAADMESGPGMRLRGGVVLPYGWDMGGGTRFPPLMALGAVGDERLAYEVGRITAIEARAVGVHMVYAPVVDVNNNPANPIINTRSYGEDPALVSRLAAAHIRGLQEHGLLATAKHFPGHGDTGVDSHIDLPVITVDKERADAVELVPYRAAIEAGVAAVMSAHIAFPALTGDSVPATLSPRLLTGLLREELGFRGLVVTDALDMGGIVRRYGNGEAAVRALQAGADVLLMPPDIGAAVDAVERAVGRGDLTVERIDRSVRKVLAAKAALGLHRERTVDLDRIPEVVGGRAHAALAEEIAARSITAARDRDRLLPIDPGRVRRILSIVYTDDYDPLAGRAFHAELAERLAGVEVEVVRLDGRTRPEVLDSLLATAAAADLALVSTFLRVAAWRGEAAVAEPVAAFVERLAAQRPTVVTAFGNPYVVTRFPGAGTHVLAWGQEEVTQRAAARALAGAQPITGVLPISIPPLHTTGAGLRIEPAAGNRVSP
ncbi:MAG TPA: glycoside hydrolase family 3 N-terminal domain-containing protein [Longimicrobiales bacterium]|nr:glycoside hydrolase family 3 N-terminal domain-containing protein [Longimicrobiales bacterium]